MVGRNDDEIADRRCAAKLCEHAKATCGDRVVKCARNHIAPTHCKGVMGCKDDKVAHCRGTIKLAADHLKAAYRIGGIKHHHWRRQRW
eukprot:595731-Prymnesium_polylepis.2